MKKFIFILSLFVLLTAVRAQAATDKYTYDPVHTQVMFSVSHLGFSFSHGKFNKFSGDFMFDSQNPEASQVNAVVDINSLDMASADWEKHLKGPDFFNAEKFPTMTFTGTKIVRTGEKTGTMTGDLTLLGVTKPVMLDITFNGEGAHPMNKNKIAGFSATGHLKRSEFGMDKYLPMVGDDVSIMIEVEGIRQDFTHEN